MWRRQQVMAGFRAGWRNAAGTGQAIRLGVGLGIVAGLTALAVAQVL